jgi:hypothetical protein
MNIFYKIKKAHAEYAAKNYAKEYFEYFENEDDYLYVSVNKYVQNLNWTFEIIGDLNSYNKSSSQYIFKVQVDKNSDFYATLISSKYEDEDEHANSMN